MNKIRYILGIIYVVGVLYGCHKSGVSPVPSAENASGSMSVILVASPSGANAGPSSPDAGSPVAAKTNTRVLGPAFSRYQEVNVEINKVLVHHVIDGWVELKTNSGVFDLMTIRNGSSKTLVDKAELSSGTFDKIALTIGDQNSIVIDADSYNLKPGSPLNPEMRLNTEIVNGKNTEVTLDFNAYTSISCVDYGCFVLTPLVAVKAVSVD